MRVTDMIIREQILNLMMSNQERMVEVQRQISSGREVDRSSDNPVKFERAARFKSLLAKNEQHLSNIEDGIAWIITGTEALDSMYGALQQIKEMGLQSRNDATQDSRALLVPYTDALIEEMIVFGNARHMDKYIFGGTITKDTEPFGYDGAVVTYQGNDGTVSRKVGEGTYMQINTLGSEFVDVYEAAIALRDAMAANDGAAMDVALAKIDAAAPELLNTLATAGSLQRKLELTRGNLEAATVNLKSYISQAEDVDLTEAILRYNAEELGYRAALESSTRIMNISILDYLQ